MNSPKAAKDYEQKDEKSGQNANPRSGRGLSETGPRFSLLMLVVKGNFAHNILNCSISHVAHTPNYSIMNLRKKIESFEKI